MSLRGLNRKVEKQNIRHHFEYDDTVFEKIIWTWDKEKAQKAPCYEVVYLYRDNINYYDNLANIQLQAKNWKEYIRENL